MKNIWNRFSNFINKCIHNFIVNIVIFGMKSTNNITKLKNKLLKKIKYNIDTVIRDAYGRIEDEKYLEYSKRMCRKRIDFYKNTDSEMVEEFTRLFKSFEKGEHIPRPGNGAEYQKSKIVI